MNSKKLWEYKVIYTVREDPSTDRLNLERELNELGSLGWELVGYVMNDGTNGRFVAFKRELG